MASVDTLRKGNLTPAISYVKISMIIFVFMSVATIIVITVISFYNNKEEEKIAEVEDITESFVTKDYYPDFVNKKYSRSEMAEIKYMSSVNAPSQKEITLAKEADLAKEVALAKEKAAEIESTENVEITLTDEEKRLKKRFADLQLLRDERRLLLMARRGKNSSNWGAGTTTAEDVTEISNASDEETDPLFVDDFKEHEIDKDVSTVKVDLSRTVTADRYIPCILVDQINSQLEGRAVCRVESNVFGFSGRYILIPAGTVLIGRHGSLKKVGDERFNVSWGRAIRPDGVHIKLTEAYASDAIGGTGVEGIVNSRRWEKYGGAILTSTISVLAQMSIPTEGTNITANAAESYSTDLGRVTAAMLQENINIKPYSIVPAGERIMVTPSTDIWLKKVNNSLFFTSTDQVNNKG